METPTLHSRTLSAIVGAEVVLKFENLQFTASFKERGALVKLLSLTDAERTAGVIAMSAGNHAQAVALHARRLGISATIVMPRFTPSTKVVHTRGFGAEVVLAGDDLAQAGAFAGELASEHGLTFVHPYDDEDIIRGQGTVALEMLEAEPQLDALVVPVGGGGLIAGSAVAASALRPGIEIVGVQTARYPQMARALGRSCEEAGGPTVADGIAVPVPGEHTLPILRELVSDVLVVEEETIEEAVLLLLDVEKTVVEGAGAAGLAGLLAEPERFRGRRVGVILSGGNIDLLILSSIIQRGLARTARLVRVRVELRDLPGTLAEVTGQLGESGANIVELRHQRAFTTAPVRSVEVEFVLQTRGTDHLRDVLADLASAGFPAQTVD